MMGNKRVGSDSRLSSAILVVAQVILLIVFALPCFAAPTPITCDPKAGIWNFGLEWEADSCVPKDITDSTVTHYKNNALVCNQTSKQVELFASYGEDTATVTDIAGFGASQGYKIFRNKEGTHIVMVHPDYTGLIDEKDMTTFSAGTIYTDIFKQGFILPTTPKCKKGPECNTCPCPTATIGSTADLNTGALSLSQELFSLKGGQQPLSISLAYHNDPIAPSAIGSGWSHNYEQSLQILANGSVTYWSDGKDHDYRQNAAGAFTSPAGDTSTLVKNGDTSYTITEIIGLTRNFDATGRITTLTDKNGNSTTFTYSIGNGKLTGVSDPSGRIVTFAYDANGKLGTITDPKSNRYTFSYALGNLNSITIPDGGIWNYSYTASNLLASRIDPLGNSTSYAYDAENRVTSGTDPQSKTRTVDYVSGGGSGSGGGTRSPGKIPDLYPRCFNLGVVSPTDPNAIIMTAFNCDDPITIPVVDKNSGNWKYEYDYTSNTLKSRTDPFNNKTSYTHDINGRILTKTEPGIGTTWYTYDAAGNTATIKDPLGNITTYTYNSFGQVLTTSGPQGDNSNTYDPKGNLLTSTDTAGATTTYEYDTKGNVTKITNAKNQITTMTYTPAGQLLTSSDPAGITTSYTYDSNGNMLTSTGPSGTTTYAYDSMNRITTITDPLNNVTSYGYDKQGNRITQTDANGIITTYTYNYQGQVTEAKDALNSKTSYSYGATGGGSCPSCSSGVDKLTSLSDAKSQTTSYEYDLVSRLTKETDPLNKITSYTYDTAGNLQSKTDANGITTTYTYDALRRLTTKSYPDTTTETYSYDAAGRVLTAANKDISYSYTYDTAGRVSNITDNRGYKLDYEYDILGIRTKTTLQKDTADQHITSYTYDTANRPKTITSNSGTFTYDYDTKGRRSSSAYPNGITTSHSYDTLSRLTQIKHTAGATTIAFANYSTFDKVGNRTSKITSAGTENYSYDPTYRLIQAATPKGTENYSYDPVGNRLTGPGAKDTRYQYNAGNQMLMGMIFGHDYDNNGNQITRTTSNAGKGWTYTWDYGNRLIKSEQTKGTEIRTVTFKYDPQGRRTEKKLVTIIAGIPKTSTWHYVYDNDNIAMEIFTNETGTSIKTFYTQGAGTDEHLALERNGSNYFYHADGLGSITAITDQSRNVVQSYEYDSFGMNNPQTNFANSYTYTGREIDKETGLYYYRARYLDPMEGRFVSKDPIGFKGGDVNLYGYTGNNPINVGDPTGLIGAGIYGGGGMEAAYTTTTCCENKVEYEVSYFTICGGAGLGAKGGLATGPISGSVPFGGVSSSTGCPRTRYYFKHETTFVARSVNVQVNLSSVPTAGIDAGLFGIGTAWVFCSDTVITKKKKSDCCSK